jgi:S1-C subfamily serine protease
MLRVLFVASLFFVIPRAIVAQPLSVLHIKVALVNGEQQVTPVPRHVLLISDNPPSTAPRRVVTALDGTIDVRLRPGSYIVESDVPVTLMGLAYNWMQAVDVTAGGDARLELNAGNAIVEPVSSATTASATTSGAPEEADSSAALMQWQDSVVALWTPTTRASGFVIDANGLIATSQRAIGAATSIEVQLTPAVKVAGSVLVADRVRDVAIVRIDPQALAAARAVPLGCGLPSKPTLTDGGKVFTIGWPLREPKGLTYGTVSRGDTQDLVSDFTVPRGSTGAPLFAADGRFVGITSVVDEKDDRRRRDFRVVTIDKACEVVASAQATMAGAAPPGGGHLPVEPAGSVSREALKELVQRRAGSLSPYAATAADFEIAFITPVQVYGEQYQSELATQRDRTGGARSTGPVQVLLHPLMNFGSWSDYVADLPPVLLVRVTPKLVERFWTRVARGAAQTQGLALPARKQAKSGFSRMRTFCGATEVTPTHPFTLEQSIPGSGDIDEGLYVFDPGALGPECGTVKLVLYSEKEPEKGDTVIVDPKIIQQIREDFAPDRVTK